MPSLSEPLSPKEAVKAFRLYGDLKFIAKRIGFRRTVGMSLLPTRARAGSSS